LLLPSLQYNELYVGNPRDVAYIFGSNLKSTHIGAICNSAWLKWKEIKNPSPGNYDFNCIHSVADINNNAHNNGYEIGGLNRDGHTVAMCHIDHSEKQLCDSDTVDKASDRVCDVWIVCKN
jgi:hypothetical protein